MNAGDEKKNGIERKKEKRDRRTKTVTPLTHIQSFAAGIDYRRAIGRRTEKTNNKNIAGSSHNLCEMTVMLYSIV